MFGIGAVEILFFLPLILFSIVWPVAVIVLLVKINRKVNQIEQRVNGQRV